MLEKETLILPDQVPMNILQDTKEVRWRVILAFFAGNMLFAYIVNFYWLRLTNNPLEKLQNSSHGFVNEVLVLFLFALLVLVGGLLFGVAKLSPRDVGLQKEKLLFGVLGVGGMWALIQLVHLAVSLAAGHGFVVNPLWRQTGLLWVIGVYLALLFGNAFYEEIAYRGFLLPQLVAKINGPEMRQRPAGIGLGIVASQLMFASFHIPINLFGSHPALAFLGQLLFGMLLALVYLLTRNLFFTAGLHALLNGPPTLFASPLEPSTSVLVVMLVILVTSMLTHRGKEWLSEASRSYDVYEFS
jgi:membrane protease YdiL (CAAX protease family)